MNEPTNHLTNSSCPGETGFENLLATKVTLCLLLLFMTASLVPLVIQKSNILEKQYGADLVAKAKANSTSGEYKIQNIRMGLWTSGITLPLLALLFPYFATNTTSLSLNDLGWKKSDIFPSVKQGFIALIILLPLVYFLQFSMVKIQHFLPGQHVADHPLTQLAGEKLMTIEWTFVFFSAVIGGPILEEQFFRGLIQPWMTTKKNGFLVILACSVCLALVQFSPDWHDAVLLMSNDNSAENSFQFKTHISKALLPLLFSILVSILIIIINKKNRAIAAIASTALLFGMIHAFAWPSPVGLTLLGTGMGLAYAKTRNIITPIFIHIGFNSIAFGVLLFQSIRN